MESNLRDCHQLDIILEAEQEQSNLNFQQRKRYHKYAVVVATSTLVSVVFVVSIVASFQVRQTNEPKEVVYFIAADEVLWNYAPYGKNLITWTEFGDIENLFVQNTSNQIGRLNYKAIYREYTDETFSTLKERSQEDLHLGILGPIIRASVGDTIRVHFKNNVAFPTSIHPHGVQYSKENEGSPYGGLSNHGDISPGDSHIYVWEVPERSGPGPSDFSSIMWLYHSHHHEEKDVDTGLIGGIIITKKWMGDSITRKPIDIDREFIVMLKTIDENNSWYLEKNLYTFVENASLVNKKDPSFMLTNRKLTLNGFLFGNGDGFDAKIGERIRWHVFGLGTAGGLHTLHWHGQTLLEGGPKGYRKDTVDTLPAVTHTLDMKPDISGEWMLHCHVDYHGMAGMATLFTVTNK